MGFKKLKKRLKKAAKAVSKIAKNPLFSAALGIIPGAGIALSAVTSIAGKAKKSLTERVEQFAPELAPRLAAAKGVLKSEQLQRKLKRRSSIPTPPNAEPLNPATQPTEISGESSQLPAILSRPKRSLRPALSEILEISESVPPDEPFFREEGEADQPSSDYPEDEALGEAFPEEEEEEYTFVDAFIQLKDADCSCQHR